MKYKLLSDGRPVPVLGLGTGRLGLDPSQADIELRAIQEALEMGYTHIDTAEMYGGGDSEALIGQAIQGQDRARLFLTSKVSEAHLGREEVFQAIEGSLRRLQTDYLDLYLIHAPDPAMPLEVTFGALNELVERGKTRYIGVSNFDRGRLELATRLAHSLIATDQVHYNLYAREPEENGTLEYCRAQDILLTAYSPLEHGRLLDNSVLQEIARARGATSSQVALAWLMQKSKVITIVQSINRLHQQENLAAVGLILSDEETQRLDRLTEPVAQDDLVPSSRGPHHIHGPFAPE